MEQEKEGKINGIAWGKTQFDYMSKEELLLFSKRAYHTLVSANGQLRMDKALDEQLERNDIYWSTGVGARTLKELEFVLKSANPPGIPESRFADFIYSNYYRYAFYELFGSQTIGSKTLGTVWYQCEQGHLTGNDAVSDDIATCNLCESPKKRFTLSDLEAWEAAHKNDQ